MCSPEVRKEANRLMWMVKGRLIPDNWKDDQVEWAYDSYFKRLWNNHENCYREDGFEEAYQQRLDGIENVAMLGYD
jgi:hypothetical protein